MESRGGDGVSITTTVVVVVILLGTLLAPTVTTAVAGLSDPADPLRVSDAEISTDVALVKGDFGSGTYHISSIRVRLSNVSGHGTLLFQIGIPALDSFVLTGSSTVDQRRPTDRTVEYQPSVEFQPDRIRQSAYPARITVRAESGDASVIVAETTVTLGVRDG